MLCFGFKKRHMKGEKHIAEWILQNILENRTFHRKAKFIMADFYTLDFMEGIILVKTDEMYNILKSLLATRYWSRDEGGIKWSKLLLESALQCPYI